MTTKQFLYRVDAELLSIKELSENDFNGLPPVDTWLPAMFGAGYYCYKKTEDEAKETLIEVIDLRIKELLDVKNDILGVVKE